MIERRGAEHEGELADLRQDEARQEGALPGLAHQAERAGIERRLEHRDEEPEQEDDAEIVPQEVQIDQQSARQEENHQKAVLNRYGRMEEELAMRADADEKPGKERAEGRRQAAQAAEASEATRPGGGGS